MTVFNSVGADRDALSNLDLIKTREGKSPHLGRLFLFCCVFVARTAATLSPLC